MIDVAIPASKAGELSQLACRPDEVALVVLLRECRAAVRDVKRGGGDAFLVRMLHQRARTRFDWLAGEP